MTKFENGFPFVCGGIDWRLTFMVLFVLGSTFRALAVVFLPCGATYLGNHTLLCDLLASHMTKEARY